MNIEKAKVEINRDDLKNNILQRIIFRVDYKGVVEIDNDTVKKIAKVLPLIDTEKKDWQFEEAYAKEIDFELNDPDIIETKLVIPVKELNKIKTFKYTSCYYSTEITINKYFTAITIGTNAYRRFDFYNNLFSNIVHIIKNDNDFMRIIRIGLRKINALLIKNLDSLNEFFEIFSFNNVSKNIAIDNVHFFRSETIDNFCVDYYNFNLIRVINEVLFNDENVYQTVLDIDGYIKEEKFSDVMDSRDKLSNELTNINELLFRIFKDNLKQKFLNDMILGNISNEIVKGVNKNDGN